MEYAVITFFIIAGFIAGMLATVVKLLGDIRNELRTLNRKTKDR